VRAALSVKKDALLVPQKAVSELQGGFRVAVVGDDNKVEIRAVETAERVGDAWVVDKGLKRGENVIVAGLQMVKPGAVVRPKPASADPTTTNGKDPAPEAARGGRPEGR
jgi:membrane fusion protein (multidrug efflux system)